MTVAHTCTACGNRDWTFESFERDGFLFTESRRVFYDDKELKFSRSEYKILVLLASEHHTIAHEQLIAHASVSLSDAIAVHVCRINSKCIAAGAPKIIQSEWGYGYCWKQV